MRGLINCGNSCFINVVLQALLACHAFRAMLHENDSYSVPERDDGLLAKFVRLEREMCTTESEASGGDDDDVSEEPLLPDWFYDVFPSSAPIRASGSQEDAEEFLTYILNALHEEMIPSKDGMNGIANGHDSVNGEGWEQMTRRGKSVEIRGGEFVASCITRIFGGQLRSEVTRGRGKPSVTREPFFELSLDIESGLIRDVQHALQAYFEPEYLDDYTTTNGGDNTPTARKQVLLEQMPRVLILHLKRFSHNTATGALNKVARMMNFPEILRVPERLVYGRGTGGVYRLVAVVTHVGKELAGGHYTCDVRWGDGWVSCDDSKVLRTALAKVARKQAYLLFYEAVNDQ